MRRCPSCTAEFEEYVEVCDQCWTDLPDHRDTQEYEPQEDPIPVDIFLDHQGVDTFLTEEED
jgi:hypothetical protein